MKIYSSILYAGLAPLYRNAPCSKLTGYGKNIFDNKLSVEHTLNDRIIFYQYF